MKKILLLLCFFVILGSVNAQTSTTVIGGETAGDSADIFTGSQYDGDGDGVCDEPSRVYSGIDRLTLGCTPSGLGDLCRGTPSGERVSTFGDRAGCSENQLAGFSNYWGVKFGEPRPRAVKPNWLTDQRQGVKVFQPISFFRNTEYLVENEKIEFRGATVSCRNAKGVIRTREV
tara:strand:- start:6 stop:527 length:522 start_codon:yes stop_codon:yes gene_type:complete